MKNRFFKLFLLSLLLVLMTNVSAEAASLSGRVLLQVESKGEAWYLNPVNGKRYFLGRAADAAKIIRALGLGVTNKDLSNWKAKAPAHLAGRILLQVEARGEAYYVNPVNLQLVYLGSPETAFAIWNKLALGVSNKTLATISPDFNLAPASSVKSSEAPSLINQAGREVFKWKYRGRDYQLSLNLSQQTYNDYAGSSKVYTYYGDLPANWHEDYYKMFLQARSGDATIKDIVGQLKYIATKESLADDELVNVTMAFVQSIPYDHDKNLETGKPNYPYETLFRRLGVCSDKTFLAVMILRELGYGAAVIDLPEVNHAAVGIQCPERFAVFGSGYCYAETTNYLPISVIAQNFGNNGVVLAPDSQSLAGQFANVFKTGHLGRPEILQKTKGKQYTGSQATYDLVADLRQLESDLATSRNYLNNLKNDLADRVSDLNIWQTKMEAAKNDIAQYNSLVQTYNNKVNQYKEAYQRYKEQLDDYNAKVNLYNSQIENFYPSK